MVLVTSSRRLLSIVQCAHTKQTKVKKGRPVKAFVTTQTSTEPLSRSGVALSWRTLQSNGVTGGGSYDFGIVIAYPKQ